MVRIENHCSDCEGIYRNCIGCTAREVEIHCCDKCNEEFDEMYGTIYEVDDMELCEECLKEMFLKR